MKLPYILIVAAFILVSGLCQAQTTPDVSAINVSAITSLSKAKPLLNSLIVVIKKQADTLEQQKIDLETSAKNLEGTNKIVLDLNQQIITLGKDRDTGWNLANDRLTTINKQADKITKMQIKVAEVAIGVGLLCGLVTVLAILYFLGSKAWTSGPYGFAAIAGAALVAWIAGFAFVEHFFNS